MVDTLSPSLNSATGAAVQKMAARRGAGARQAVWLLTKLGIDLQHTELKLVDGAIADRFHVSERTARRWRTGYLAPPRYLEEMARNWGAAFVLDLFGYLTAQQLDALERLPHINRAAEAIDAERAAALTALASAPARFQASDNVVEMLRAIAPQSWWSRARRYIGWAWANRGEFR